MHVPEFTTNIGTFLNGLAAFFTFIFTIITWIFSRKVNYQTKCLLDANSITVQKHIADEMLKKVEKMDSHDFFTMDMGFPTGEVINIPMIEDVPMVVFENVTMSVLSHNRDYTMMLLKCKGYGTIPVHFHSNSCEEIQIFEGTMTCLITGKIYQKGDIWKIDPNIPHGALLHNCRAIVTHKPPLLTAKERPVNLHSMESIFKKI